MLRRRDDNLHRAPARRQGWRSGLALLITLAGCAADEPPGSAAPDAPEVAGDEARPAVLEGSIVLEGMREPMTYRLFRAPPEFPLRFSTYVPQDMEVELERWEHGPVLRFVARFGPRGSAGAGVSVLAPAEPLDADGARALAAEVARRQGEAEVAERPSFAWALEEQRFRGAGGVVGRVALARHRGRFFLVVVRHPAQMGDGLGPRVGRILDEWRWRGGGALGG